MKTDSKHHGIVLQFLNRGLTGGAAGGASPEYVDRLISKYKRKGKETHEDWRQLMYLELGGEEHYIGSPYWLSTNAPSSERAKSEATPGAEGTPEAAARAGGAASLRPLFLSGMGCLYLIAFFSYYLQFPGLFGEDGIQPLGPALAQVASRTRVQNPDTWDGAMRLMQRQPSLLWLAAPLDIALDAYAEAMALMGCLLSVVVVLGGQHAFIFIALFALYLSLYLLGQSMLSFQWDIFLLETGFATILYAPLWGGGRSSSSLPPVAWLLRFQLFKIMFMSGIVKTQANCPTWKSLTALEYHFASQCLPTAEAWWATQLPPFFLRLGVAATFVTQIPAPFLVLAPSSWCRRLGVLAQAPLQLLIMLTGNYNWFNLHVLLLCIPCWDADTFPAVDKLTMGDGYLAKTLRVVNKLWSWGWLAAGGGLVLWSVPQLISFSTGSYTVVDIVALTTQGCLSLAPEDWAWTAQLSITNKFTVTTAKNLLDAVMPHLIKYIFIATASSSLIYVIGGLWHTLNICGGTSNESVKDKRDCSCTKILRRTLSVLLELPIGCVVCYAATIMILVAAVPLGSMDTPVDALLRSELPTGVGEAALAQHASLHKFSVVSGYGLFRRMTGVGPPGKLPAGNSGWGGLSPQTVQVPAIVMEGTVDGKTWQEIPFRYVQGNTSIAPRRVAPLQPRLDWRMWFAALGSYQHDPWLIHLGAKLMAKAPGVLALMDTDRYPFNEQVPIAVRSSLYHWDFTRLDTPWARDTPGTTILINSSAPQWWARKHVNEYAPALQLNNPSLKEFLGQFGWRAELLAPDRQSACTYSGSPRPAPTAEEEEIAQLVLPARLVALILSDNPGQLAKDIAASVCMAVVQVRVAVTPLRESVGWTLQVGGFLPATTSVFVDAHLAALFVIVCGSLLLKRLASALSIALSAAGGSASTSDDPQSAQTKAKKE